MNSHWDGLQPIVGDVVIVQGEEIIRAVMTEVFSCIGARVFAYESADAALVHIQSRQTSCVLVVADHGLPGPLQGAEFIGIVREKWPTVSSILISGYTLDSSRFPAGSAFLKKPWSIDDLITTAALLLEPSCAARRI